jgi:threonine dehydratase
MATTNRTPHPDNTEAHGTHLGAREIAAAHDRIREHIHRTPVLSSHSINLMAHADLFFKCENFQRTGSFKIRGASNTILSLSDDEAKHGVVAPSSGNHAAAVACAASWRLITPWIVMPKDSAAVKIRAVESYGGKITFCEPKVSARNEAVAKIQEATGAILVHPYDDDRIIAGQATATKELLEEIPDLDAVLAPVSGGGLLSGTVLAAKSINPQIRVFGCEPQLADDTYRSMKAGAIQTLESSSTIADGLRANLSPRTFAILQKNIDGVLLVAEDEITATMHLVWERMKIVVEPSSAVALAPLLRADSPGILNLPARADGKRHKIGVILSGGNVDLK